MSAWTYGAHFFKFHLKRRLGNGQHSSFRVKFYQFKAVPYGFKNSLSAFIRALEKVLGDDEFNSNLVMYLVGLVRLSALLNIYNRDARVEVDSDACREEIDV